MKETLNLKLKSVYKWASLFCDRLNYWIQGNNRNFQSIFYREKRSINLLVIYHKIIYLDTFIKKTTVKKTSIQAL